MKHILTPDFDAPFPTLLILKCKSDQVLHLHITPSIHSHFRQPDTRQAHLLHAAISMAVGFGGA